MALPNPLSLYCQQLPENLQPLAISLLTNLPRFHSAPEDIVFCLEPVLKWGNTLSTSEQEALVLLLAALHAATQNGCSALPFKELPYYFKVLTATNAAEGTDWQPLLNCARQLLADQRPDFFFQMTPDHAALLTKTAEAVYTTRHFQCERELIAALEQICARTEIPAKWSAGDFDKIINQPFTLSSEQIKGCITALTQPIAILAGGPGSGKTAVIAAILRLAMASGIAANHLALAAPTGKAANRIGESLTKNMKDREVICPYEEDSLNKIAPPQTIHRLLGYGHNGYNFGPDNPLPYRLIIVDEASMIDLPLMNRLLNAVAPQSQILLVGDPQQLPPVGCATIFKNLCHKWQNTAHMVTLASSFRMENQNLATLASTILQGKDQQLENSDGVTFVDSRFNSWNQFLEKQKELLRKRLLPMLPLLSTSFQYGISGFSPSDEKLLATIYGTLGSSLLLAATNDGPRGVLAINQALHFAYQEISDFTGDMTLGEPLICTKNDYFHNIFNGDIGFVAMVKNGTFAPCPMAIFPQDNHFSAIPLEGILDHITLAHAITVHKSQGSEVNSLTLVLPERDSAMLSKELLYTAITRARRTVEIYGDNEIWNKGLKRQMLRYSGI